MADDLRLALQRIAEFHRMSGRHDWNRPETPFKPLPPARVPLPPADLPQARVSTCLERRASCRRFDVTGAVSISVLSDLLHTAYGHLGAVQTMNRSLQTRPVPSASGLYALTLLVFAQRVDGVSPAVYRFAPADRALVSVSALPDGAELSRLFADQDYVAEAAAIVVLVGEPARVAQRYFDRAYRYLLLECGHVGQNLVLGAAAAGLGACPVGGFEDYRMCCAADLDPADQWPLYAVAIGRMDPAFLRDPRMPENYG